MAKSAAYSRTKGHNMERAIVNELKEIGYVNAKTSRYSSKLLDDSKVDINYVPFNIQSKAVKTSINYVKLIAEIRALIKKNCPDRESYPLMIFHKRATNSDLVIMERKDLYKILEQLPK